MAVPDEMCSRPLCLLVTSVPCSMLRKRQLRRENTIVLLQPPRRVARRADSASLLRELTPREREVMALVVRGATDREIARDLDITVNTVNIHLMAIRRKLHVTNRVSLATIYYGDTPYHLVKCEEESARTAPIEVTLAYAEYGHSCTRLG